VKSFNNYGPAIRDLQRECAMKLRRVHIAYGYNNRPAQRYIDDLGRVKYRPWSGPIGGPWIKGASHV
jgi:hypothetical protein